MFDNEKLTKLRDCLQYTDTIIETMHNVAEFAADLNREADRIDQRQGDLTEHARGMAAAQRDVAGRLKNILKPLGSKTEKPEPIDFSWVNELPETKDRLMRITTRAYGFAIPMITEATDLVDYLKNLGWSDQKILNAINEESSVTPIDFAWVNDDPQACDRLSDLVRGAYDEHIESAYEASEHIDSLRNLGWDDQRILGALNNND